MIYLALGDSVSIDRYTGIEGGGAASQFARLIGADEVQDLTHDGFTTDAVLESLRQVKIRPDVVTLTVGGNDLLQRALWDKDRHSLKEPDIAATVKRLREVYFRLSYKFHNKIIVNTIYDPTDGDDTLLPQLGLQPTFRKAYNETNQKIREMARRYGFLLSNLQELFKNHGMNSPESWITMEIEPNYAGATAIAKEWHRLYLEPEKGVFLRDIEDGWTFSLVATGYQFPQGEKLGKEDAEWLRMSFGVASPECSWSWLDSSLMFSEAKLLAAWLHNTAADNAISDWIDFVEPDVSFGLVAKECDTVTVRVCLYNPSGAQGYKEKHTFRQVWAQSTRPLTEPPHPDRTAPVVCRDFRVTREDLLKASQSLLDNLRQLPPRDGLRSDRPTAT